MITNRVELYMCEPVWFPNGLRNIFKRLFCVAILPLGARRLNDFYGRGSNLYF
jgi:hypothetical protein